jgi:hypothetical protein
VSPSSRLVFGSVMLALLAVALTAYGRTSLSPAAPPSLAAPPSPLSASGLDQPTPGSPPAADGDLHILVDLDAAYVHLLRPANQGEELGDLVVEPVCVKSVTQTDAIDSCAADPDPLAPPYPAVGERVWMEGRYVFDLDHGGWAELHPLYRWGLR